MDYKADVWLNEKFVGTHEGGESPFLFNVTDLIKPGAKNRLAVRVLNPTHQAIDGIVLNETPHRNKALPYSSGSAWNQGGIWDSVEVLTVPAVRVEDLFARPDWRTGQIRVQLNIRNAGDSGVHGSLQLTVAPAATGETLVTTDIRSEFKVEFSAIFRSSVNRLPAWPASGCSASMPSAPTRTSSATASPALWIRV